MAENTASGTGGSKLEVAGSTATSGAESTNADSGAAASSSSDARSRFTAALDEARAGAAALTADARDRAAAYGSQARTRGESLAGDARTRAGELAVQGKSKASEALTAVARLVGDNATTIDEKLGAGYGDYARSASQSLQDTASRLEQKSVEELGEDAREFVRKSPATAVGLAALAGYLFARILRK
jgi:ElaB/YqjD/DUF883 family membrane-anchored ribosome-binding protein